MVNLLDMFVSILLISVLLDLLCVQPMTSEGIAGVSCIGGEFYLGDSGTVTCYFPYNINTTNHNFNVVRYPFKDTEASSDASGNTGDYVLLCNWAGGNLQCKVEDGFTFNHKVTSTLTLGIPEVTSRAAGLYVCQLVPTDSLRVTTCNLTVTTPPPDTSERMLSSIPIEVFIPVVAVLGALVLLLVILLFCYHLRIKHRPSRPICCHSCTKSKSQNPEDNEIELREEEAETLVEQTKMGKIKQFFSSEKAPEKEFSDVGIQVPKTITTKTSQQDKVIIGRLDSTEKSGSRKTDSKQTAGAKTPQRSDSVRQKAQGPKTDSTNKPDSWTLL